VKNKNNILGIILVTVIYSLWFSIPSVNSQNNIDEKVNKKIDKVSYNRNSNSHSSRNCDSLQGRKEKSSVVISKSTSTNKRTGRWYSVWATKYNPVKDQCDNTPHVTADNSKIHMGKLKAHNLRWIAVSKDLLNQFKMGDIVEIKCDNEKLNGIWEIHDRMNSRFHNKIDFLVPLNDKYEFHKPIIVNIRKVYKS
jgi:3D (Asp-Asp-Asp) domain-containing protein